MSESSRNKASQARPRATGKGLATEGAGISVARTALSGGLVVLGIVWMAVYLNVAQDGKSLTWMGDLGRWNFLIGFGLIFLGLALAANPGTPLGRGRGIVVGMLGCFLIGLIWIVVYYIVGQTTSLPVVSHLSQYNLVVGIGFMAVGFVYATRWE